MKKMLVILLATTGLLMSCKSNSSSPAAPGIDITVEPNNPTAGEEGGGTGTSPGQPESPYNYKATAFSGSQKDEYTYVEALEMSDTRYISLQFYTRAPMGMCNVSTLTDSSWYQPNFKFLRLVVDKTTLGEKTVNQAKVGTRGTEFGSEMSARGTMKLISQNQNQFKGWVNLVAEDKTEIRGNFDIVSCGQSETLIKNLKLDDLYKSFNLVDKSSGATYPVSLSTTYSRNSYGNYEGYLNRQDNYRISFSTNSTAPQSFRIDFSSIPSGEYLSIGNNNMTKQSPGPGIAIIKDNSLIINDQSMPHMNNIADYKNIPKTKIEYIAAKDNHKVTVYLNGRELVGEF